MIFSFIILEEEEWSDSDLTSSNKSENSRKNTVEVGQEIGIAEVQAGH